MDSGGVGRRKIQEHGSCVPYLLTSGGRELSVSWAACFGTRVIAFSQSGCGRLAPDRARSVSLRVLLPAATYTPSPFSAYFSSTCSKSTASPRQARSKSRAQKARSQSNPARRPHQPRPPPRHRKQPGSGAEGAASVTKVVNWFTLTPFTDPIHSDPIHFGPRHGNVQPVHS